MSEFNNFAQRLDEAFRASQTAYAEEVAKLTTAQKNRDDAFAWSNERAVGTAAALQQAQQKAADIGLKAAQEAFRKTARKIMDGYTDRVAALKREVADAVNAANLVDTAQIDSSAIALLNSGVMNSADYRHMMEQFEGNVTMRRMIGEYARRAAEDHKDDRNESVALRAICNEAGQESFGIIETFNSLADASIRYMGASNPERYTFAQDMQAHWDDGDIRAAIENF